MRGPDIGRIFETLSHDLYIGRLAVNYTLGKLEASYKSVMDKVDPYTTEAVAYLDDLARILEQYKMLKEADWVMSLQEKLMGVTQSLHESYIKLEERYNIREVFNNGYKGLKDVMERLYKITRKEEVATTQPSHAAAVAAILFLAVIGLGSFLFVSQETTARVAAPAAANLPLGITLLAILVIGVVMMPHRKVY